MNASGIQSLFHRSARHTTHYLAAGPADGPLLIFVHGWPELSRSWRHQLRESSGQPWTKINKGPSAGPAAR